ncbi:hypothetical protein [[Mycobacterium] wendilense]|uniref:Keratin associated protein n=1 Tax=[Mycobacterium] wendilense TaxID=3064284 RepID=A0ABM9MA20_9MYCO|nr:hypothetical protein [Mycolicibacterium sp. MU0050]CAJ1580096.1 hypothetical protein MU0050_000843 [Mycolicibacterium sp. MU0050]
MRVLRLIVPALMAGGAAAAIIAAPAAAANPLNPNCEVTSQGGGFAGGSTTQCSSPGNTQIVSRPPVYAMPWYGDPFYGAGMVF